MLRLPRTPTEFINSFIHPVPDKLISFFVITNFRHEASRRAVLRRPRANFFGLHFHPSSNHVEWQQGKCEQKRGREDYSWHVACFFNFEANRGRDAQEACSKSLMFSYSLSSPLGPAPSTPGIRSGAKLSKRLQSISKRARVRQVGASIGAAHLCSWPR